MILTRKTVFGVDTKVYFSIHPEQQTTTSILEDAGNYNPAEAGWSQMGRCE